MKGGSSFYPGIPGGTAIQPFGSNAGTGAPPMRYTALLSQITPSRTWALIQADVKGASVDYSLSAGSAYNSPEDPVLGNYRLALFFDWSVGRIPTGTNLRKEISIRQ
jgi:hypothetical protein